MWTKIWPWLFGVCIVAMIGGCNVLLYKDKESTRIANTIQHATVLLMQKSESGHYYNIYLDGFGNENWSRDRLRLTIDKTVPKDEPSALFGYNTKYHSLREYEEIILSFHDKEDLVKYMGNGSVNVSVQSGRDSNVSVSNSNSKSDACFIAALGGR